jgi:hypothetical protein
MCNDRFKRWFAERPRCQALAWIALGTLAGCSASPSVNIFGSYFPSWMLCAFAGLLLAALTSVAFGAAGIDKVLPVPLLVYLALSVAFAFGAWLLCVG